MTSENRTMDRDRDLISDIFNHSEGRDRTDRDQMDHRQIYSAGFDIQQEQIDKKMRVQDPDSSNLSAIFLAWNEMQQNPLRKIDTSLKTVKSRRELSRLMQLIQKYGAKDIVRTIRIAGKSSYLSGRNGHLGMQFSWFLDPANYEKVRSQRYTDLFYAGRKGQILSETEDIVQDAPMPGKPDTEVKNETQNDRKMKKGLERDDDPDLRVLSDIIKRNMKRNRQESFPAGI